MAIALMVLAFALSILGQEANASDVMLLAVFILICAVAGITMDFIHLAVQASPVAARLKSRMQKTAIAIQSWWGESEPKYRPSHGNVGSQVSEQNGILVGDRQNNQETVYQSHETLYAHETAREKAAPTGLLSSFRKEYTIIFILIAAFGIRLYHLDAPIIGVEKWRQADTASMAYNYYTDGFRFLYPEINWGGATTGVVESEFPIFPFLVGLCYKSFGFTEQWGRLLSVLFWLSAVFIIYQLLCKLSDRRVALWTAALLSFLPVPLYYSRAFMPESMMIMCSVAGVYFFVAWLETNKLRHYILSTVFIALAGLLKLTPLYLLIPLAYLAWIKYKTRFFLEVRLWGFVILVLTPIALWYAHAHQLYLQSGLTFGIWGVGEDKWGNLGLLLTPGFWKRILADRFIESYTTWAGFPVLVVGLLQRRHRRDRFFDWWLIAVMVYIMIVAGGNYAHEYYQLPFIIPAAFFMARALARYIRRDILGKSMTIVMVACLVGIIILSAISYRGYMSHEEGNWSLLSFADQVQRKVEKDALIVAVDRGDPTFLYLVHRKGWHAWPDKLGEQWLAERMALGGQYLMGALYDFREEAEREDLARLGQTCEVVLIWDGYFLFKLPQEDP